MKVYINVVQPVISLGLALAVITLLLCLGGCATANSKPEVIQVPFTVPCRAPAVAEPQWATDALKLNDSIETKVRALLAERYQARGYIGQLRAAVGACQ